MLTNSFSQLLPQLKAFRLQSRPEYSQEELNVYRRQNASIIELFSTAEQCLGRLLSPTDQKVLYGFYDWLNMPIDLIKYLLEYCKERNHTQLRYIESVAVDWNNNGIKTVEQAQLKTLKNKNYFTILKRLGLGAAVIAPQHRSSLISGLMCTSFL